MKPSELKPCPFCGVIPCTGDLRRFQHMYKMWCRNCGAEGPDCIIIEEAARESWNDRFVKDALMDAPGYEATPESSLASDSRESLPNRRNKANLGASAKFGEWQPIDGVADMKLSEAISLLEGAWIDAGNDVGIELGIVRTLQHKLEVAEEALVDAIEMADTARKYLLEHPSNKIKCNTTLLRLVQKHSCESLEEIRKDEI